MLKQFFSALDKLHFDGIEHKRYLRSFARPTPSNSRVVAADGATVTVTADPSDAEIATITSPTGQTSLAGRPNPSHSGTKSTNQPTASTIAPLTAEDGESSGSSSPKTTPIIVGVVLGVVVALLGILLTWHCMKRKRRLAMEEAKKDKRERWPLQDGPPPWGNIIGRYGVGSHSVSPHHEPTDDNTLQEGGARKQAPYSPQSLLHPSMNDVSVPSSNSSPNNYGLFPAGASSALPSEMSGASSPRPELSPNPERWQINQVRAVSPHFKASQNKQAVQPCSDEGNPMKPNLGISHGNRKEGNKHVMSWMSYEDGAAGPTTSCSR
ncbi:MAG: hypothetical protein Q9216_005352 [Gyalolechia sp. 2 TL-2023]